MPTWMHEETIAGRECLLVLPGLDYAVRPRIGRSFSTAITAGRSGVQSRGHRHGVGRLSVVYAYTFPETERATAAEFHAALLALGKKLLALPIELDRLAPADFADDDVRIFDAEQWCNYDAVSGAYSLNADDGHPESAGLILCSLLDRPTFRAINDYEFTVTIRAEEDSPWAARVAINTISTPAWTLEADWAQPVEDLSAWQLKRDHLGRGREKSREGDDAPALRGQRATFTLSDRTQIRHALTFFEAQRGQQGAFTVPTFLRPDWDGIDGNEPVMQARFGNDVLWLDLANQDQARTQLTFWQVPILLEGEPEQEVEPPLFAVKLWWSVGTTVWAWTDGEAPVTIDEIDYVPTKLDVVVPDETLRPGESDWELLVRDFVGCPLRAFSLRDFNSTLNVEIREYRASDPDGTAAMRFAGKIGGAPRSNKVWRARAVLVGGRLRAMVPDATVKTTCNNLVYDPNCKLDAADFTDTGEITAIDGRVVDIDAGAARAADWYAEGYVQIGAGDTVEIRHVVRSEPISGGTRLTLLRPLVVNIVGAAVDAIAGCDSQFFGGCAKFANQLNFFGAPHKPPYIEAAQSGIKTKIGK